MPTTKKYLVSLLTTISLLLLSGCSGKEAMTDPKLLDRTSLGCFQTSFSFAKKRHSTNYEEADKDFDREVYSCMVRNVLGKKAQEEEKRQLSETLRQQCPFKSLTSIVRTEMVECLTKEATPFVQTNQDRLKSG
jgi:hypothetical protein